jgi:site-specific DNA recombinase
MRVPRPLGAVIYARYSTGKQRPTSIEDQVRVCRAEIARRGWKEVSVYADAGVSGSLTRKRPQYQALFEAAASRDRDFDVVVVDDFNRLSRDREEQARALKRLAFWEVGFVAVADNLDTMASPEAATAIAVVKGFTGENQLRTIAHDTHRGIEGRVRVGYSPGGAPYGYRSRPVYADRPGDPIGTGPIAGYEPIVCDFEAEVVVRIFELYCLGWSARRIAAALNAEGIRPPGARWRNRTGRAARTWSASAISGSRKRGTGILNNERYIGLLVWNRSRWLRNPETERRARRDRDRDEWVMTQREDLRIVPQELWDKVKRLQDERGVANDYSSAHRRGRRLLSGFLKCAICGSNFVLHGRHCYACAARLNRGEAVCSARVTVDGRWAEPAILGIVQTTLFDW